MGLGDWLREQGLQQYEQVFAANDVDFDLLSELTEGDLKDLGLSLGHRRKMMRAIRTGASREPDPKQSTGQNSRREEPLPVSAGAERRQLTVLFCDLVGSTGLAARLDPEDMSAVLGTYRHACTTEIGRHGGMVAKFVGDGVIAYFGYPRASEEDAACAVRAALALASAVPRLDTCAGEPLQARIGIATGKVVVGERIGEGAAREQTVVGETPNLAARLQGLAEAGGVVVSPVTQRLAATGFAFRSLGVQTLKGIEQPLEAWVALRAVEASSRFDARHAGHLGPLIGRREELDLLLHRRAEAWNGNGQVFVLSGEAGIGKSRLAAAASEGLEPGEHLRLCYQGSDRHSGSLLHPFLSVLRRSAGFEADDPPATRLDKLEAFFSAGGPAGVSVLPVFAELLGIPGGSRYAPAGLAPRQQRERIFESYFEQLRRRVRAGPLLILFEDVHWFDATSLDLVEQVVQRVERMPVLCVVTCRPGFSASWLNRSFVTSVTLGHLDRRHVADLIRQVVGARVLPPDISAEIVARADGVPLFVEEITKAVIASGQLDHDDDRLRSSVPAIPDSLQDSLMARLDALPAAAKELAQVGATIGREFSPALISAVLNREPEALAPLLSILEASELVIKTGGGVSTVHVFKHALIQDIAYSSQLRSHRRSVHRTLAEILPTRFPEVAASTPEVVAHHLTEAGQLLDGVVWWRRAGEQALQRAAYVEGLRHIERGRHLVTLCPESADRAREELKLEVACGAALLVLRGQGSPEVRAAYDRAASLSRGMAVSPEVHTVLLGLWRTQVAQADLDGARETGQRLLDAAQKLGDRALLLASNTCLGLVLYHLADFERAWPLLDGGVALHRDFDEAERRSAALLVGLHPYVGCLLCTSFIMLLRGEAAAAAERQVQAVDFARTTGDPFQLVSALGWSGALHILRDEPELALLDHGRSESLLADHAFPLWQANADLVKGAALVQIGSAAEGIACLRTGLKTAEDAAYRNVLLRALVSFAQGSLALGLLEEGSGAVERAFAELGTAAERWWEPELHRLSAELNRRKGMPRSVVEDGFQQALTLSRRLGLKLFERRASDGLARLCGDEPGTDKISDIPGDIRREIPLSSGRPVVPDDLHTPRPDPPTTSF